MLMKYSRLAFGYRKRQSLISIILHESLLYFLVHLDTIALLEKHESTRIDTNRVPIHGSYLGLSPRAAARWRPHMHFVPASGLVAFAPSPLAVGSGVSISSVHFPPEPTARGEGAKRLSQKQDRRACEGVSDRAAVPR